MDHMSRCGTTAGYMAHRRAGEATCIECKSAWRRYYQALRAAKNLRSET